MPRTASPTLESFLPACETHSTVEITLRNGTIKRYCSGDEILNLGGNDYYPDLLRVGELKEVLGQATNNVSVKIANVRNDSELGKYIADPSRKTELADVVIKRLYHAENDMSVFEWKHFFTGKAVNSVADQELLQQTETAKVIRPFVSFDVIPDTTAAGTCIATVTLSPNNGFKFPDVPDQSPPGSGDNEGTPIGGGHCFTGDSKFIFFDRSEITFAELYARRDEFVGQDAARSFDKATRAVRGEIQAVFRHEVFEYLKVTFADGTDSCVTAAHPFFTPMLKYVEIGSLKTGDAVFNDEDEQWLVSIHSIEPVAVPEGTWVYNVRIGRWKNYSADHKRVHNKDLPDVS